ncbi:UNVERIFIED_CONTAM: hypothetical protein RMT77_003643 [Armadillidium vulgare]
MFRLPEPESFCFCIDLKIGSLIIAIFSLLGSIINILTWVSGIRGYQLSQLMYQLYDFDQCDADCQDFVYMTIVWVAIIVLALDGLHVIMCSLLIHGIRKDRPKLFLPYLSWLVTRLVINIGLLITLVILFRTKIILIISFVMVIALCFLLDLYFFLVINAHKNQIMREQGSAPLELKN